MVCRKHFIMDAARIRSLAPAVDTRAATGTDTQAGRSDADIVVQKVAPLLALDTLLGRTDGGLGSEAAPDARAASSVVVNLMLPVVTADAARKLANALANAPDYSHLDPHKPHPEHTQAAAAQALADELEALNGSSNPAVPRAPHELAGTTSPAMRSDLHPLVLAHAQHASGHIGLPMQRSELSAVNQARDSERLAGLNRAAERYAGTPARLSTLALAAAFLGFVIVVVLM